MDEWRAHLDLDVEVGDSRGLRGTVARDGAPDEEFTGWLGLLAVLDRLLAPPGTDRLPQPTADDGDRMT